MRRKLFVVFLVLIGLLLFAVAIASAGSLTEKPYAEGQAGLSGSQQEGGIPADKGYPEGEGALSSGSREGADPSRSAEPEGSAGSAGTGNLAEVNARIDSGDFPMSVLYMFSGTTDDGEQGSGNRKEATSVTCSNISSGNIQVEVQIWQWNGTDVYTGTSVLLPNHTVTYSTQNTTIYFDDVIIGGSPGTPAIFQGSGRVLADNVGVVCSAQVLDPLGYPPVYLNGLEMYQP